jgi:dephospho-CoA kinase
LIIFIKDMIQVASTNTMSAMKSKVNINIICGFKNSGKHTIADILERKYNYKHLKISNLLNSKPINSDHYDTNCITRNEDLDIDKTISLPRYNYFNSLPSKNQNRPMVKHLLQMIETEYIIPKQITHQNIVISDLKYMNEYEEFIRLFYKYPNQVTINVIKMIRNNTPRYYTIDKHESDIDHLNFSYNYIIENNSNIDTLIKKIHNLHFQIQNDITTNNSCRRINMTIRNR